MQITVISTFKPLSAKNACLSKWVFKINNDEMVKINELNFRHGVSREMLDYFSLKVILKVSSIGTGTTALDGHWRDRRCWCNLGSPLFYPDPECLWFLKLFNWSYWHGPLRGWGLWNWKAIAISDRNFSQVWSYRNPRGIGCGPGPQWQLQW